MSAILLAVIAAAVYRASVFSQFEPIRVDVVSAKLHASRGIITATLPDLSSYREGRLRRQLQEGRNVSDILDVPLLMKFPGQRRGEVVDRIVETVDIFPTILDVVGAKASLRLDGRR